MPWAQPEKAHLPAYVESCGQAFDLGIRVLRLWAKGLRF